MGFTGSRTNGILCHVSHASCWKIKKNPVARNDKLINSISNLNITQSSISNAMSHWVSSSNGFVCRRQFTWLIESNIVTISSKNRTIRKVHFCVEWSLIIQILENHFYCKQSISPKFHFQIIKVLVQATNILLFIFRIRDETSRSSNRVVCECNENIPTDEISQLFYLVSRDPGW